MRRLGEELGRKRAVLNRYEAVRVQFTHTDATLHSQKKWGRRTQWRRRADGD